MTAKVGDFGLAKLLIEKMSDETSISSTHVLKGSTGYIPPEYGLGVKPSTAGDAYSFGVMLLELFTGKSPTDDSFIGGQNLVGWVQSAIPANILQVLDPELLPLIDNSDNDGQTIKPETQYHCLIIILGIGLACTVVSPDGRISIRNTLSELEAVRNNLLSCASTQKSKY